MSKDATKTPKKTWRLLGCLIKAPLGCLAFTLGALVVLVLFVPPVLGKLISHWSEEHFEVGRAGSLEVKEAWFGSLYGPQRIESIILRGPDRDEIFHGYLEAPSLYDLVIEDSGVWGPVVLQVENMQVEVDENGVSNLARALEPIGLDAGEDPRRQFQLDPGYRTILIELRVERFSWSDSKGRTLRLRDLRCAGEVVAEGYKTRASLGGRGTIEGAPEDGLELVWTVDELLPGATASSAWNLSIAAERAPTLVLHALFESLGELDAALLEDEVTGLLVEIASDDRGERRIRKLRLESGDVAIALSGGWPRGEGTLVGGEGDLVSLDVPSHSAWAQGLVQELLPLTEEVHLDMPGGKTRLRLRRFVLPFDGDLGGVRAHCTLQADDLTFRFPPALEAAVFAEERERITSAVSFELDAGEVRYDGLKLPVGEEVLIIRGSYDLSNREYALVMTLPDLSAFAITENRDEPRVVPVEE